MKPLSLLLLLFAFPTFASEIKHGYRVQKTVGPVLVWLPFQSYWIPVEPQTVLPEGSLLQLLSGGQVRFSREGSPESSYTLNDPQIVRLQESSFKDIKITPGFRSLGNRHIEASPLEDVQRQLETAWKRVVAFQIDDSEKKKSNVFNELGADIEIFSPLRESTQFAESLPFEIPIFWREIAPDAKYEIHLSKPGAMKSTVVESTSNLFYRLKWNEPGEFYIQIKTHDGAHYSQRQRIYLALSMAAKRFVANKDTSERPPTLLLPPPSFIYSVPRLPLDVTFQWDGTGGNTLFLTSEWNKTRKLPLKGNIAQIRLTEPGEYTWRVGTSELRKLILKQHKSQKLSLSVAEWLQHPQGILFVDN